MTDKFSKYFFYALGEIFLVVIGILIALQVNNWNEYRKSVNKEKELLGELIKDIDRDLSTLKFQLTLADTILTSLDYLIRLPEEPQDLEAFIEKADGGTLANYRYSAMKSIESIGIDIIQDKELTNAINDYYKWWDFGNELYRVEFDPFYENVWMPFFRDHMIRLDQKEAFTRKFKPKNYQSLIKLQEYRDLLIEKRSIFIDFKYRFERSLERAHDLRDMILIYIN